MSLFHAENPVPYHYMTEEIIFQFFRKKSYMASLTRICKTKQQQNLHALTVDRHQKYFDFYFKIIAGFVITRVWNGLDTSARFIIQSSPGGFGLDWISNSPSQGILD